MPKNGTIGSLPERHNPLYLVVTDSRRILEVTAETFKESVKSLRECDTGHMNVDIHEQDQRVNQYVLEVRRKVLKHLAITGGVNIMPGLILTNIATDIGRVGDQVKNITELAIAHPQSLRCGDCEEDVKKIEIAVTEIFGGIVPTFESSDKAAARTLIIDNSWIEKCCDEIHSDLIEGEDSSLRPGDNVVIALYVRYLKGIVAHLLNALSCVVNPYERSGFRDEETPIS
jgi:phosphate uptake regulator